ncbi:type II toxin-antitoxin system RelE family toxin [Streptomyces acidicola]|uniref:Uncharacterized protein n=1 Tax=Streptomyces acidicola TaxID=2596892 RepID=A0A5N8WII2_9ACTN|nr:hypothetical protein [Streptomyces acidicola]MPY47102.1 hypothetical protein [Streptomyces acidicola]MPY47241.1 hypothetical protein [Streptomyces acidicola]
MYKLRYSKAVEAVWDALPDDARAELDRALIGICQDPWAHTEPRSDDLRDVERTCALQHTAIALLVIAAPPVRRVYLRNIDYLG